MSIATVKLKIYNCIVFTDFQHKKIYPNKKIGGEVVRYYGRKNLKGTETE